MKKRIVIVDDERSIRFALAHYFTHLGFTVDQAGDGAEARELITANDYSLAIVDIHLGDRMGEAEDGLDLAAWIRNVAASTAVVILTGLESPEALQRAHDAGVRSFLRKPAPLALVADLAFDVLRENESNAVPA